MEAAVHMLALPTGKVAGVRNVFSFSCTGLEDRLPLRDQRLSGNGSCGWLAAAVGFVASAAAG